MRTIGVVSVSRSDYGLYVPVLREIERREELELALLVAGSHLSQEFGATALVIEADGFPIAERIETLLSSDTPEGVAKSMGLGLLGFAQAFARQRPDLVLVLGDRFEMHAAALAALPFAIPVAHIHGGELTQGAIDDALRHSMTKLSHLHFVATEESRQRVLQMGEEPWRVVLSGSPAIDQIRSTELLSPALLRERFGLRLPRRFLLVTYHPVTLEYAQADWQIRQLLEAVQGSGLPAVFTAPNQDTNGRVIRQYIESYVRQHPESQLVTNFGSQGYLSLMALASAMVGNSSSGIIEAGSFELPVVNVGTRQEGRLRGRHVLDVNYTSEEIRAGIERALGAETRETMRGMLNPYGVGRAAELIVERLAEVELDDRLLRKRFVDAPAGERAPATEELQELR